MDALEDKKIRLEIELLEAKLKEPDPKELKRKRCWDIVHKITLVSAVFVPLVGVFITVMIYLDDYRDAQRFRISGELLSILNATREDDAAQIRSVLLLRQYGESAIPLLVYALGTMPTGIGRETASASIIDLATESQEAFDSALLSLAGVSRLMIEAEKRQTPTELERKLEPLLISLEMLKNETREAKSDVKWKSRYRKDLVSLRDLLGTAQDCNQQVGSEKESCLDRKAVRARLDGIIAK